MLLKIRKVKGKPLDLLQLSILKKRKIIINEKVPPGGAARRIVGKASLFEISALAADGT